MFSMHKRHGRGVHHAVAFAQEVGVLEDVESLRRGVDDRIGRVDTVDLRPLQQRVGVDLERTLGRAGIGGEVRHAQPGGEDHDATLLEVPDRAQRHERLGHLRHRDRRLDAGRHVDLLQGVLQGQGVHDRGEHAHVVGTVAVDAGGLPAAPDVAAADDHRRLDAHVDDLGQLPGDQRRRRIGDAGTGGRGERLAGELEQDPVVRGPCVAVNHACRTPPPRAPDGLPRPASAYSASSPSLNRTNRRTWTFSPVLALTSSR